MNHNGPCYTIQEQGRKNCGTCEMSVAQQAFVDREIRPPPPGQPSAGFMLLVLASGALGAGS